MKETCAITAIGAALVVGFLALVLAAVLVGCRVAGHARCNSYWRLPHPVRRRPLDPRLPTPRGDALMRWNREAAEAALRDLPLGSLIIDTYTPLGSTGRQSFFSTWLTDDGELQGQVSHAVVGETVARWRRKHVGVAVVVDNVRLEDLNCRTCSRPMRVTSPGQIGLEDHDDCGGDCWACVRAAEAAEGCPA